MDIADDAAARRVRAERWSWTLFDNPADGRYFANDQGAVVLDAAMRALLIPFDAATMKYLVYQLERAPDTGRLHLQGYVRFHDRKRLEQAKATLAPTCRDIHMEKARGTEKQNRDYCTSSGEHATKPRVDGPWEYGTFDAEMRPGKRSDLDVVCDRLKEGNYSPLALKDAAAEHPTTFVRACKGLKELCSLLAPPMPKEREVQVTVLWGPTGTGKTHRAMHVLLSPGHALCTVSSLRLGTGKDNRYDKYDPTKHSTILYEEFTGLEEHWEISHMKQALDKWVFTVPCRYNDQYTEWTRVIICSNSCPTSWFPKASPTDLAAFRRRLGLNCYYIKDREHDYKTYNIPRFNPENGEVLQYFGGVDASGAPLGVEPTQPM